MPADRVLNSRGADLLVGHHHVLDSNHHHDTGCRGAST